MGKKRFYDAVRDLIRDVNDPIEEPARSRPRLSIASLLASPPTCAACWDTLQNEDLIFACNSCLGAYCPSCLEQYARTALKDRQMLPLRCADQKCRAPVPLSGLRGLLSADEIARLSRFQCDLLRSPDDAPEEASDTASAMGSPVDDDGDKALESLMGSMGWRRCPDCGTGIERTQGCSHMVCVCGGEFCYSCGERWGVGGFGCPRRCGLPLHQEMFGLLPERLAAVREDIWNRLAALLDNIGGAVYAGPRPELPGGPRPEEEPLRERGMLARGFGVEHRPAGVLRGLEPVEREGPATIVTRMQTRCLRRMQNRTNASRMETSGVGVSRNESLAKMRLRSLVHPSTENRL